MTRFACKPVAGILALGLMCQLVSVAQEHHHHDIEPVQPVFPRLGKGQEKKLSGRKHLHSPQQQCVRDALHKQLSTWLV